MQVYLLTVGDELLIGQVIDTNSVFMARQLNLNDMPVSGKATVGDDLADIQASLALALEQAEVVLMSGGLGPTKDDITKKALAEFFDTELVFHEETYNRLVNMFEKLGRQPVYSHRDQCYLPASATVIPNRAGTAPGMWLERDGRVVVSMPGVPHEMEKMLLEEVIPRLRRYFQLSPIAHRTLLTAGEGESSIAERIADLEDALPPHIKLAYLPNLGQVRLRLTARGGDAAALSRELDGYRDQLRERLSDLVFSFDEDSLEAYLGRLLRERGLRLATAESCTGGYLAHLITGVAGASDYFIGGLVAYSNEVKKRELGVSAETLNTHGAVSEATVREMATGAIERFGVDLAIATSGIAGPGGGTPDKPVGTVWLAVADRERTETLLIRSGKDRQKNIYYSSVMALNLLRRFLVANYF